MLRLPCGQALVRRHSGMSASDNPQAGAVDSRAFGVVPPSLIEGRVLWRYRRGRGGRP